MQIHGTLCLCYQQPVWLLFLCPSVHDIWNMLLYHPPCWIACTRNREVLHTLILVPLFYMSPCFDAALLVVLLLLFVIIFTAGTTIAWHHHYLPFFLQDPCNAHEQLVTWQYPSASYPPLCLKQEAATVWSLGMSLSSSLRSSFFCR